MKTNKQTKKKLSSKLASVHADKCLTEAPSEGLVQSDTCNVMHRMYNSNRTEHAINKLYGAARRMEYTAHTQGFTRLILELAAQERRLIRAAAVHAIHRGCGMRGLVPACLTAAAQLPLQRLFQSAAVARLQACTAEPVSA